MKDNVKSRLSNYELKIGIINSYICLFKQEHISVEVIRFIKDILFKELKNIEDRVDNFITCESCCFNGTVSQFDFTISEKLKRIELICPKCKNICEVI